MSDEQFQDFHPTQCVIYQHEGGEGVRGLAPEADAFSEFLDVR